MNGMFHPSIGLDSNWTGLVFLFFLFLMKIMSQNLCDGLTDKLLFANNKVGNPLVANICVFNCFKSVKMISQCVTN